MKRFCGIDPSTKTGFVAMYENGDVVRHKDLTGIGSVDPMRITTLINEIMDHLNPGDVVCIESPAMGAQGQGVGFMWGLAYGIRMALYRRGIQYYDVAPTALKQFVDASRKRLGADGKKLDSKAAVAQGVYEHYGYTHPSNNVIDAYVLAQIAYAINQPEDVREIDCTPYQLSVIKTILTPMHEKKAKKAEEKKKKAARAAAREAKPKKQARRKPEQAFPDVLLV
jgi:crossover junction endodeoxyribonuclease RuvC